MQWETLRSEYNAFYECSGDNALPSEVVETTWTRLIDPSEPVEGLIAQYDGVLVGLAHVVFHRNLIQITDTCYMQDLFTRSKARGQGVASALIHSVCRICQAKGPTDVYWHTHAANAAARRQYDRVAQNTDFLVYRIKPLPEMS